MGKVKVIKEGYVAKKQHLRLLSVKLTDLTV